MSTPVAQQRINIYEVVNHARKESLIALCVDDMAALRQRVRHSPPREIGHWGRVEALDFEILATRMSPLHAEHFVALFLSNPQMRGWKLIPWRG